MPDSPCEGCALTKGAAANREPDNNLKAQLCVLGALPFYCHAGFDWKDPAAHTASRRDARLRGIKICAGWKREVGSLAKTGYYKDRAPLKKEFAAIGITNLAAFLEAERGSQEKKDACEVLGAVVRELNQQRLKFEHPEQ